MKSNVFWKLPAYAILAFASFIFNSCTKKYTVPLYFTKIEAPSVAMVGQIIVCQVQVAYKTTTYPLSFNGFQTKTISDGHYEITATAELTSHGEGSTNTMMWLMDTTYILEPTHSGAYILDFVANDAVFRSDTILVR